MPAYAYYPEWPRTHVSGIGSIAILAHDFNGDGRADVVYQTLENTVGFSLAQANRTFATPVFVYTGASLTDMVLGDANGDGHTDVVVSDAGTNSLVVIPSNGDATFGTPIVTALSIAPAEIASADFNGDGVIDLALRSSSASLLTVFTNDGAGHFAEEWQTSIDASTNGVVGGDIDGDGADDFLVHRTVPGSEYALYFGRGDATFDPPVITPASAAPVRVVLGDLDDDGDLEIISTEVPTSVRVIVNNGSRTFAAPSDYSTDDGSGSNAGAVLVAEVTGDAHADVVTALPSGRRLVTLAGNGNGALQAPVYAPVPAVNHSFSMFPKFLAAGDFTGDGRIDLAVVSTYHMGMFVNAAGEGKLSFSAVYPTISTGQTAKFKVQFSLAEGFALIYPDTPPFPTGTITLMNGETPVATGSFENYVATIEVPSLPLGTHTFTASFAGDANYRAFTSSAVAQNVVSERTTVTLTADSKGQDLKYAELLTLTARVTSQLPGALTGTRQLYINGEPSGLPGGPYWYRYPDVGTSEYYVSYGGNATQPPSVSEVFRQTVTKGQAVVLLKHNLNRVLRYGQQEEVQVDLRSEPSGKIPEGIVRLFDGSTLLATQVVENDCCSDGMIFNLPLLAPGVHHLRATYDGSERFNPAASDYERYTILPAEGFVIDAYVASWGASTVIGAGGLFALPDGGHYVIYSKAGNQPWTVILQSSPLPSASIDNPTTGVVYAFRMEAYDAANQLIASSNADATMITSFTDKPLVGGVPIKALHVKELVDSINILRTAANLSPIAIPDAGAGQTIKLAHLTTLRNAMNEARVALGVTPIAFSNDAAAGSPVLGRQFQELRDTMQ